MKKRILSILLTLCMVLCLVPITVFAAGGAKAILPGTSAQSILKIDKSRLSFAGHEWWVIGQKTDKSNNAPIITLLAVNNDFGDVPFRTGSAVPFENARRYSEDNGYYANNPSDMSQWRKPNEYAGSTLQQKMVSLAEAIPEKEQAVIRPKDITEGITGQEVKAQKLWAFSQEDSIYLYRNSCKYAAQWWTRSSNEVYGYGSWTIHPDGRSGSALNVDYDAAVRPAMEMDLSSVLFISAAEHGKVADLTTPIAEYAGDEWKLTLHDSDRDDFTAKTVLVNGSVLVVEYKNAKVGDNEYISAVIKDADGSISRYTRVVQLDGTTNGTRGRAAIDLTGIDMTGKTLCVFNEQFNGDHKTDYAGALREVKLTDEIDEQFTLAPGGRYYFDLSAMNIPGTVNSNLPDKTLHYVPFTYVGTVDAYSMENETDTAKQPYEHSLFIADYNVKCSLQRETLAEMNLIYGQTYTASNVNYTLRAPSVGDHHRNEGEGSGLAPIDNEWDTIYQKSADYIKNWYKMRSFGQDIGTGNVEGMYLSRGGHFAAQATFWARPTLPVRDIGFRPVLEILNADTLDSDGMKAVTLDLNGGKLGGSSEDIQIIVKNGSAFTAPASGGLTRPDGNTGSYFMWLDGNGNSYAPGASVPADVTKLTAQWRDIAVPTGEIKIAENGWKSFFNTITFDLFFKDTQMVTVTAADNSGGAVTVEYLLSEKALTESELARMTFTAYSAPFSINADNEYVIYAKLTDTSGNVAYINTNGIVLDGTSPVITGIEAGKTYCAAQTITVDEKYIGTVKVNGTEVILDENGQFILSPASGEQTIVVTDKAGNETRVIVTVNDGHTYEWQSENGQYWQKCKFCNHETAKKDIPTINISGADKVCRTQDYKFSFTLPEGATDAAYGYEFIGLGDGPLTPTFEGGMYCGVIKSAAYPAEETSFKLIVSAKTADGFEFSAEKTVAIQNAHSGGTATCTNKAVCEICGESYGELDPNNHANLKHIDAKAATKTSEGNIEYWYCSGCKKYYKDAKATQEITKADTVTAKLPPKITAGDGAAVTQGEKKELTFPSDASFADFLRVELDGTTLDEKNYTKKEDSTIITLNRDFVATLSVGEHTLSIVSKSGTATAKFTVKAKPTETATPQPTAQPTQTAQPQPTVQPVSPIPRTGDTANPALWFALLIVSGFALAAIFVLRRKANRK